MLRSKQRLEGLLMTLAVIMAVLANLPPQLVAGWSIEPRYLVFALFVLVLIGIVASAHFVYVAALIAISYGVGLHRELSDRFDLDPQLVVSLLAVVIFLSLTRALYQYFRPPEDPTVTAQRQAIEQLIQAIRANDIATVDDAMRNGVSANVRTVRDQTPLMIAAAFGFTDIIRLLVRNGAAVDAKDADGNTALSIATQGGKDYLVELLVRAGAME